VDIFLPQFYPIVHPEQYKLHLACWNKTDEPLDVFVRDRPQWDRWNAWRTKKDDFIRPFIFSPIDFYPEADTWLFGGAYRVLARRKVVNDHGYDIELLDSRLSSGDRSAWAILARRWNELTLPTVDRFVSPFVS
jgi:hypothetical protein